MAEADDFLRDIQANPDDDSPRLVFADWLEENGDPERAEFIRAQIEITKYEWPEPKWIELCNRQEHLLYANRERWLQGLPKAAWKKIGFQRGFVSSISATGKQFLSWATKLKARTPLNTVTLSSTADVFTELTDRSALSGIRHLELRQLTQPEFGLFDRCLHLTSLRFLMLWYVANFTPQMLATLLRSPALPNLETLQLNDHYFELGKLRAAHLKNAVVLKQLRDLHLWRSRFGATQLTGFFDQQHGIQKPRRLRLWQCEIGPDELLALGSCKNISHLEELSLYCNHNLGTEGLKILTNDPHFKNLRTLDLQDCRLGDEGLATLVQRGLPNLESLALQSNMLTDTSYEALLQANYFPKLRRLNLHYNAAIPPGTLARLQQRYRIIADNG